MKDLTQGNILKNILVYSAPAVLSSLLQSMYSAIDAFWVGRLVGSDAIAAVSASMPVVFFLVSLLIGLGMSTVVLTGQAYGKKDMELLKKILVNSFLSILALCIIVTILGVVFAMPILRFLNTPPAIIKTACMFITIILYGTVLIAFPNWFSSILSGLGDTMTPLVLLAIDVGINIALAPFLIAGIGFFPKMGVAGSAVATLAGSIIVTIISFIYLGKKYPFLNILKWKFKIDLKIISDIFAMGIPVSLQMMIFSVASIVLVSFVNRFGTDVVAAYGIGLRIDQFSFIPAMVLGGTASAFAAQAIGAKKEDMIPKMVRWVALLSLAFSAIFYVLVNIFPSAITSIFTDNKNVIENAFYYFRIDSFTYFSFALLFTYQGVIRGAGNTLPSAIFSLISLLLFRLGLAWYLIEKTHLAEKGIWLAMTLSSYLGLLLIYSYYKFGKWKGTFKLDSIGSKPECRDCLPGTEHGR